MIEASETSPRFTSQTDHLMASIEVSQGSQPGQGRTHPDTVSSNPRRSGVLQRRLGTVDDVEDEDDRTRTPNDRSDSKRITRRLFGPFLRTPMSWICLSCTTILFVLTALYANNSTFLIDFRSINRSTSRPIFVLRLLSGITDVLLSASCAAAFERMQWLLTSHGRGLSATSFLSLHAGTGVVGLLVLGFGKASTYITTRCYATLRLLVLILCPALGIILMIDVTSHPINHDLRNFTAPYGTGMSQFNASLAPVVAVQVDRLFGTSMTTFLKNGEITVDITPEDLRPMSCGQGPAPGQFPTCERTIFMPGSEPVELLLTEGIPNADLSMAYGVQGYVLKFGKGDMNNQWRFQDAECEELGLELGAVHMCIQNVAENEIITRMVRCPSRLAIASKCLSDTSWHNDLTSVVTTSLTATFRFADVAYHRPNGSIAWHKFINDTEVEAPITASDLLYAYQSFALGSTSFANMVTDWMQGNPQLLSTNTGSDDTDLLGSLGDTSTSSSSNDGLDALSELMNITGASGDTLTITKRQSIINDASTTGSSLSSLSSLLGGTGGSNILSSLTGAAIPGTNPLFPILPYTYLEICAITTEENAAMAVVCTDFLQNFLAIPLLWCQELTPIRGSFQGTGGLDFTGTFGTPGDNSTDELIRAVKTMLGLDEVNLQRLRDKTNESRIALSRLGYEIHVGRPSLVAYIVLTALMLLACFTVLIVGSLERWAGNIPSTGPFPLYDEYTKLAITKLDGVSLGEGCDAGMPPKLTQVEKMMLAKVMLRDRVDNVQKYEGA